MPESLPIADSDPAYYVLAVTYRDDPEPVTEGIADRGQAISQAHHECGCEIVDLVTVTSPSGEEIFREWGDHAPFRNPEDA